MLIAAAVVFIGATVQATVGFGMALVAAPVLALIDPTLVPVPLLLLGVALTAAMTVRERTELDVRPIGWAVVGRIPGVVVGTALVATVATDTLVVAIAVVVLAAVLISAAGWCPAVTHPAMMVAGATSGVMGTVASIGGPPIALMFQRAPGPVRRSALAAFTLVGSTLSLIGLTIAGEVDARHLRSALVLLPAVLLGAGAAVVAAPILDRRHARPAVLAVAGLSAVALLVKELA